MEKDLSNGKCSCGSFAVVAGTTTSINIPDDAKGVKLFSDKNYFYNVNDNPGAQVSDSLSKGAFGVGGIMETRILQLGTQRALKIDASEDCNVLVEFWG